MPLDCWSERGAGKTTFAKEYLPNDARVLNFVNADLIASGLSPLKPELASKVPIARWRMRGRSTIIRLDRQP